MDTPPAEYDWKPPSGSTPRGLTFEGSAGHGPHVLRARHNRGEGVDDVGCEVDAVPALAPDLLDDPGVAEVVDGMVSGGLGSAKTILDRPGRARGMADQDR